MVYLICNSHIDPVWLWRWDEGASETLSTFRAVADFLDEYPDLIFNHNESLLYEWIEEYDPPLFERIKAFVKTGRWEIIGGWFLQPDVNIPSGESIIRQIVKGQRYFKDRFGKVPVTANNFDSFGHSRGLVQILQKSGYKQYLVCRPAKSNYDFESPDFIWKGYDGSEVIVHRSDENYNSVKGKIGEELTEWLSQHEDADTLFLWGVGNHGGGPSRKDLDDIGKMIQEGIKIKHAVPSDYFSGIDKKNLPVVSRGLNPLMEGCYTSIIRIKQQHRRLENDLIMVESMASHASALNLKKYEYDLIADAWRDLLFAEFHDSLPGSAIQPVEDDILQTLDHGLEITSRLKTRYFFALCAGQEKLTEETVPVLVYNPHPFQVSCPVDCSFVLPKQNWNVEFSVPVVYQDGKKIPCQVLKEHGNFNMDWCKRVLISADLPPSSMSRYDVHFEIIDKRPLPSPLEENAKTIILEGKDARVVINTKTGLIDSYQISGKEYLKPDAFAMEIFQDSFNSWSGPFFEADGFSAPIGRFELMTPERATAFSGVKCESPGNVISPVRIIEDGEVRIVAEALMEYGDSQLCQRYMLDKCKGVLEINPIVFFGEKEKRLKMSVPTVISDAEYIGQTMFGREKLDVMGGEHVAQYWTCVSNDKDAVSIINDSTYGSDFLDGQARITLLRSAGYGASKFLLGEPFHEPMYQARMEQGERRFRFVIACGQSSERLLNIDREALILNREPYALPYCPSGEGEKPGTLIDIDAENVMLSCIKRSEDDGKGHIIRVFEAQGKKTAFTIEMPKLGMRFSDEIDPFEIRTYRLDGGKFEIVPILE